MANLDISPAEPLVRPPRWYVAETEVHRERTAAFHIEKKGFEVYLPMRIAPPNARKVQAIPYFPRYLFVRLALGAAGWTAVFSAVGFKALVGNGDRPTAMADSVVRFIRQHERDGFIPLDPYRPKAAKDPFTKGDAVRVKDGVLADMQAIFDERIDEKRVWILLKLLGRDSRAAIEAANLVPVASGSGTGGTPNGEAQ